MKKLMIVAAAAAFAANTYGIAITNCHKTVTHECPEVVFKITASGKTVVESEKGDSLYSSITSLKVSKGALVLFGEKTIDEFTGEADCCYPTYSLYLPVKVGKTTKKFAFLSMNPLDKWSAFGKNLEKVYTAAYADTKSVKASLESDLGLSFTDEDSYVDDEADFDEITGVTLVAVAFGKVTYKFKATKTKTQGCQTCTVSDASGALTPGNYSGWFAGFCDADDTELVCLNCQCPDIRMFGGTWKAKYNKSMSVNNGWKKAVSYSFGSGTLADMIALDVE